MIRDADRSGLRATVDFVVVFALCMATMLVPETGFFFRDDVQHQYLPVYYEIGRSLRSGVLPLDSALSWFGGDWILEYQYALFNPLALVAYLVLPAFDDLVLAATWVAAAWWLFLCAGAYGFVRSLAGHRLALLAVALVGTTPITAYWFASAWLPGLLSLAWFPWLLWGLGDPRRWGPARAALVAVACYGIATAGWPQGALAMGLVLVLYALVHRPRWGTAARAVRHPLLPAAGGILLAAPAWLPVLLTLRESGRQMLIENTDFLVAPLPALLNLAFPTHLDFMNGFDGFTRSSAPYFFLSPLLCLLPFWWTPSRWRQLVSARVTAPLFAAFMLFALASLGPSHFGPFRWPFRFLLYAFLFGSLLLPLLFRARLVVTRTRGYVAAGLAVLGTILAWQKSPALLPFHGVSLAIAALLIFTAARQARPGARGAMAPVMTLATLACALYIHLLFPHNADVADWNPPAHLAGYHAPAGVTADDTVLFVARKPAPGLAGGPEFFSGNLHLFAHVAAVNGYSPLPARDLQDLYCFSIFGLPCDKGIDALTVEVPGFGATPAELAGVTRVIVRRTERSALRSIEASPRLAPCGQGATTLAFCPTRQPGWPKPVTWAAGSVQVQGGERDGSGATLRLRNTAGVPAMVVLALPWRPGREASFVSGASRTGPTPIARGAAGATVVEVPPNFDGTVQVARAFPHRGGAVAAMAFGATLLVVVAWGFRRERSPAPRVALRAA